MVWKAPGTRVKCVTFSVTKSNVSEIRFYNSLMKFVMNLILEPLVLSSIKVYSLEIKGAEKLR